MEDTEKLPSKMRAARQPLMIEALLPIVLLVVLLVLNVQWYEDSLAGPNQMALLLAAAFASLIAIRTGMPWKTIRSGIMQSINSAMGSILILLLIGALGGTWLLGGIVPSMIYYGLDLLNPAIFLFAACLVCAMVAISTGSSWATIATIGVALLGIGKTLGINEAVIAGAIISGSYFGDKMSPMSDTTNLAPAMAGTDLFTHVRYMLFTTVPTMAITLIIFLVMGFWQETGAGAVDVSHVKQAIDQVFFVTPFVFLVPALVIFLIVKKTPPIPALFIGVLAGGLSAIIFQPTLIMELAGEKDNFFKASYIAVQQAMFGKTEITTADVKVSELLTSSGMAGMLKTVWLTICAMVFGGVMEAAGLLQRITRQVIKWAKNTTSLVASTAGTCVFFNFTASDQYISIVVPGKMYADTYRKRGLKPEVLSRTLEDSGTVTSVLVPWNTCGAAQSLVLGVPVEAFAFYCFFNIISPFMSILVAFFNFKIRRYTPEEVAQLATDEQTNNNL